MVRPSAYTLLRHILDSETALTVLSRLIYWLVRLNLIHPAPCTSDATPIDQGPSLTFTGPLGESRRASTGHEEIVLNFNDVLHSIAGIVEATNCASDTVAAEW